MLPRARGSEPGTAGRPAACAALLGIVLAAPLGAQATRPDTLMGRMTSDRGTAIAEGQLLVTRAPDRAIFRTTTGPDGHWQLVIAEGTGDYLVHASAAGFATARRRITRDAAGRLPVADLVLATAAPQALTPVTVAARRERPTRDIDRALPRTTGDDQQVADGLTGALAPVQQGELSAIASLLPGVQSTAGGLSLLGLPGAQTLTTLNGLAFGGSGLPRGAPVVATASSSAWSVTRGGFSGGQVDLQLGQGGQFSDRTVVLSLDAPPLQVTDAPGRALGARSTRLDANVALSGMLDRRDRYSYSGAARLLHRASPVPVLGTASDAALAAAGLAPSSAATIERTLEALELPTGPGGGLTRTDLTLVGRIDRFPYDLQGNRAVPRTWGVLGFLQASRQEGLGGSPLATGGTRANGRDWTAALQFVHSQYAGNWLHDTRSGLTLSAVDRTPTLALPRGVVRVAATDDQDGVTSVLFGGGDGAAQDRTRWTWETTHTTRRYATLGTRHLVTLFAQQRLDGTDDRALPNALGTVSFASLDDLTAGRAAAFSRALALPPRAATVSNSALGVGSRYRPSSRFQLEYGVRAEVNAPLSRPAANAALARLGIRSDLAPVAVGLSPRIGFRYAFRSSNGEEGYAVNALGTRVFSPSHLLRGGIGEFRNIIAPELVAGAVAGAGAPGGVLRLDCAGPAVPLIDWAGIGAGRATIPSRCLDGTGAFAERAAAVRTLAPDWRPPRSWRANLGWSTAIKSVDITLDGVVSWNLDQPSTREVNFGARVAGVDGVDGRERFVSADAIDPATGAIAPLAWRRDPSLGRVLEQGAAARSLSTQLRVLVSPPMRRWLVRGAWVVGSVRAWENGFDQPTAGDPRRFEWAPGEFDVRHQLQLQLGRSIVGGVTASVFLTAASGAPFTPIVAGDVNGDGSAFNDRAFITRRGDAAFTAAMDRLEAKADPRVRRCLVAFAERIAARGGCRGPWTAQATAQLALPITRGGLPAGSRLSLFVENPLAGLDQLINRGALRGWGTPAVPDPVLYAVRGYDRGTGRFRTDVNPRFGATDPARSALRAPFRVTVDVRIPLGAPWAEQQLQRSLRGGRAGDPGPRLDAAALVARYRRNVPNIYDDLIEEQDSLLLSPTQVTELRQRQAALTSRSDSVWRTLAEHLAALPDRYDATAALAKQEAVTEAVWALAVADARRLHEVLTPQQLRLLPWPASTLSTWPPERPVKFRIYR
jgi:hypothetical protein